MKKIFASIFLLLTCFSVINAQDDQEIIYSHTINFNENQKLEIIRKKTKEKNEYLIEIRLFDVEQKLINKVAFIRGKTRSWKWNLYKGKVYMTDYFYSGKGNLRVIDPVSGNIKILPFKISKHYSFNYQIIADEAVIFKFGIQPPYESYKDEYFKVDKELKMFSPVFTNNSGKSKRFVSKRTNFAKVNDEDGQSIFFYETTFPGDYTEIILTRFNDLLQPISETSLKFPEPKKFIGSVKLMHDGKGFVLAGSYYSHGTNLGFIIAKFNLAEGVTETKYLSLEEMNYIDENLSKNVKKEFERRLEKPGASSFKTSFSREDLISISYKNKVTGGYVLIMEYYYPTYTETVNSTASYGKAYTGKAYAEMTNRVKTQTVKTFTGNVFTHFCFAFVNDSLEYQWGYIASFDMDKDNKEYKTNNQVTYKIKDDDFLFTWKGYKSKIRTIRVNRNGDYTYDPED